MGPIIGAVGAAAIPAIGSLIGGERANRQRREAAQRQMDFQERMSSTAYQRSMADMRKAGLNPMLAYMQGGASSPGGAMPNVADTISPAVNSAMAGMTMKENLRAVKAGVTKTQEETKNLKQTWRETHARIKANFGHTDQSGKFFPGLVNAQTMETLQRAKAGSFSNVGRGEIADLYQKYPILNQIRGLTDAVGGLKIPFTKGRR